MVRVVLQNGTVITVEKVDDLKAHVATMFPVDPRNGTTLSFNIVGPTSRRMTSAPAVVEDDED